MRKELMYFVVFLHAVQPRPYRVYDDPVEDIFVGSLVTATRECINAMMESEVEDLRWTGPPTFLDVAKIVSRELVLDPKWPDWREMSQGWVYERLTPSRRKWCCALMSTSFGEEIPCECESVDGHPRWRPHSLPRQ